MNARTRSTLYSMAVLVCIATSALAFFFFFKAKQDEDKAKNADVETVEADNANSEKKERPVRQRRPPRHELREARVVQSLTRDNTNDMENFKKGFHDGLENYRNMSPEERARTDQFLLGVHEKLQQEDWGTEFRKQIQNLKNDPEKANSQEAIDAKRRADEFSQFVDGVLKQSDWEQELLPEEDATIGQFIRDLYDINDFVQEEINR